MVSLFETPSPIVRRADSGAGLGPRRPLEALRELGRVTLLAPRESADYPVCVAAKQWPIESTAAPSSGRPCIAPSKGTIRARHHVATGCRPVASWRGPDVDQNDDVPDRCPRLTGHLGANHTDGKIATHRSAAQRFKPHHLERPFLAQQRLFARAPHAQPLARASPLAGPVAMPARSPASHRHGRQRTPRDAPGCLRSRYLGRPHRLDRP
jgi:hypothetical protein